MEAMMPLPSAAPFTVYVGIDWADRKHDFCLQAAGSNTCEAGTFEDTPEAIAKWVWSLYLNAMKKRGSPLVTLNMQPAKST
jgi:hypothetical protein